MMVVIGLSLSAKLRVNQPDHAENDPECQNETNISAALLCNVTNNRRGGYQFRRPKEDANHAPHHKADEEPFDPGFSGFFLRHVTGLLADPTLAQLPTSEAMIVPLRMLAVTFSVRSLTRGSIPQRRGSFFKTVADAPK
jgi:hypothetical protein